MMMSLSGRGETAGGPSSTASSESTVAQPEKKNIDYDAVFENLSYLQFEVFSSVAFTNNKLADPHPFGYLTVNVNSQMQDETYEISEIKEGDGMYLPEDKRIRIFGK